MRSTRASEALRIDSVQQVQYALRRPSDHRAIAVHEDRALDQARMRMQRGEQYLVGERRIGETQFDVFRLTGPQDCARAIAEHPQHSTQFLDRRRPLHIRHDFRLDAAFTQQFQRPAGLRAERIVIKPAGRGHVRGPLVFNTIDLIKDASLAGFGLAYLPRDQVREHIDRGRLISVLEDWCPKLSGYHLYYPNRKPPAAFALVVEALRYKG